MPPRKTPVVQTTPAQPKIHVIQVDTRSPYDDVQGPMRTWQSGPNQHEMQHAFFASNPMPPRRSYWTLTALQNAWQCARQGWRYEFAHVPHPPDRHPSWVKIRHVLHCWKDYDPDEIIVVLDTDAWIRDTDGFGHLVTTKLNDNRVYLAAGEPVCHETECHGAEVMNGGFMCFKIDDRVRQFLQKAWDIPNFMPDAARYLHDWPWEQATLCRAYKANEADCHGWMDILPVPMCNTPAGTHVSHCWYKDVAYDLVLDDLLSSMGRELLRVRKPTLEFVVAKYQEDVSWVNEWVPFVDRITIYDKSDHPIESPHPKIRVVHLPNVGRESHTYAYHFAEHYDDLCDSIVCTQGRHDDHMCKGDFDAMVRGQEQRVADGMDVPWSKSVMQHFGWTADRNYTSQHMQPAGMTMGKFFLTYIGDDLIPEERVRWWPGGIFRVTSDHVKRHPRAKFRTLVDILTAGSNPETGHMMERCWRSLLIPPNY